MLTTAWVGDSRAVLGRISPCGRVWQAVELTEDHKPAAPREMERILRNQGRVERCGALQAAIVGMAARACMLERPQARCQRFLCAWHVLRWATTHGAVHNTLLPQAG